MTYGSKSKWPKRTICNAVNGYCHSCLSRKAPIGQSADQDAATVAGWIERGRWAVQHYERGATCAEWMFRKMEAFANQYGHRLAVIRLDDVFDHLVALTRRGHQEWQVMQSLDAIYTPRGKD